MDLSNNYEQVPERVIDSKETFLSKHPWLSILLLLILYIVFAIFPGGLYFMLSDIGFYFNNLWLAHVVDFFGVAILFIVVVPLILGLPTNRNYGQYLKEIGVTKIKPIFRTIVFGIIAAVITLATMLLTSYLTSLKDGIIAFTPELLVHPLTLNIYTALRPGIWEEVAFRGVILVLLLKRYSKKSAIIMNGILFGAFHAVNLFVTWLGNVISGSEPMDVTEVYKSLFQVVYASFFGIFLAYLFVKTKSIIPCILAHYLVDGFSTLVTNIYTPYTWVFYALMMIFGLGLLPAILNTLIVRGVCKKWPQPDDEPVEFFDTFLEIKSSKYVKTELKTADP